LHGIARFSLLVLVFLAPLPVLGSFNLARAMRGREFEPFADNVIGYFVLTIIFAAAASAIVVIRNVHMPQTSALSIVWLCFAGALGSAAFTTFADFADSYFTSPGIGWAWPLGGAVLGGGFGALYGLFRWWLLRTLR